MKVLFLSQGRKIEDHPGWDWSLAKLKADGLIADYLNIPWQGYGEKHGWDAFYRHVVEVVRDGRYEIVYFHCFHRAGVPSPASCIKELRGLSVKPTIITSAGDPFSYDWMSPRYPLNFREVSRLADITYTTQMGKAADAMAKWGARNVVLSPLGMCPVRFKDYAIADPLNHKFDFDVIMVGSRNGSRFHPLSRHYYAARFRMRMVKALCDHFGKRFGLFGHHWDGLISAQGPAPFDTQQLTFQRGRVFVGGTPYALTDYYMSNRPFMSIAAGVPTVEIRTPRMEKILRDNDQVYFADDIPGVIAKCEELLKQDPVALYAKAARAAKEMAERHTQYNRMKFKIETAMRFRQNGGKLDVQFPFFLPEVDLNEEKRFAIRER